MQMNHYEFKDDCAYLNGERLTKKCDLICAVKSLISENCRLEWGGQPVLYHYDDLTCPELVAMLKCEVNRHREIMADRELGRLFKRIEKAVSRVNRGETAIELVVAEFGFNKVEGRGDYVHSRWGWPIEFDEKTGEYCLYC